MNEKAKKIFNISLKVISWLLIAFTVLVVLFTLLSVFTVDKNDRSIFGLGFYIVKTDSMSKSENNADMDVHIDAGDIVVVKKLSPEQKTDLQSGDIITFTGLRDGKYEVITHMIRERTSTNKGELRYITFGTNTGVNDKDQTGEDAKLDPSFVLGKYLFKIPKAGTLFAYMKTVPGYIVCILVPFLLLIIYNGVNVIRIYRKYKNEQNEAIEAEKAQIQEERAETQRMMEELLRLKEELARKTGETSPPDQTIPSENKADEVASEETSDNETQSENKSDDE